MAIQTVGIFKSPVAHRTRFCCYLTINQFINFQSPGLGFLIQFYLSTLIPISDNLFLYMTTVILVVNIWCSKYINLCSRFYYGQVESKEIRPALWLVSRSSRAHSSMMLENTLKSSKPGCSDTVFYSIFKINELCYLSNLVNSNTSLAQSHLFKEGF